MVIASLAGGEVVGAILIVAGCIQLAIRNKVAAEDAKAGRPPSPVRTRIRTLAAGLQILAGIVLLAQR